ncbi:MAG: hypothetical protein AABX88_00540 [Nanoarchaeota archaeon]
MSWFNKKEEKKNITKPNLELPELPKLPELPELEEGIDLTRPLYHLPSFPTSSIGDKFSRNTIKDAITGEKEEGIDADELESIENEIQEMRGPYKPFTEEVQEEYEDISMPMRRTQPVFIRIDKFEESLNIFKKTKEQIGEIEKMLSHIKTIKEDEEKELESWEKEIQSIKKQIQRVDSDVFSKIE